MNVAEDTDEESENVSTYESRSIYSLLFFLLELYIELLLEDDDKCVFLCVFLNVGALRAINAPWLKERTLLIY